MKNFIAAILLFASLLASSTAQTNHIDFRVNDIDGNTHTLSEYLEKGPVYISFWALWCQPCLHKMRLLNSVHKDFNEDGFTLLAVNVDNQNSMARVRAFVNAQRYDFPVLLDPNEQIFELFNGRSLPFAVLMDETGILETHVGFIPGDEKKLSERVENLLSGK
jgi:cytochrome c biogenesis protein CcmG/thiol:disulfide interchange protein DsbE